MKNLFSLFVFANIILCQSAQAYLYPKTWDGRKLRWELESELELYVNPNDANSLGIGPTDVQSALLESVDQWNQAGSVRIRPHFTDTLPSQGTGATLHFSSNPAFFGSGVLAVTSVSYNSSSGTIYSADIMMNDTGLGNTTFTASKNLSSGSYAYVGDVLTHEIGHLLGLNHSEVAGSSMLFSIFKGQHSVSSDDVKGIEDLYSSYASSAGFRGTVVAQGMLPVFGAHVQAINLEDNEVIAGVFTEEDGTFSIKGLNPSKSYALYVSPIRSKENLPSFFSTFRADFCDGKEFAPSFFSKCGGRSAGKAQAIIPVAGRIMDLGSITVKCSTGMDPRYLRQKTGEDDPYTVLDYLENYKSHGTFTGYFTDSEILAGLAGKGDKLQVDLSGLDASALSDSYLSLSLSTEKLGSALGVRVYAKRQDEGSWSTHTFGIDPVTGKPELDFTFHKRLSTDSDQNIFDLEVYPIRLSYGDKTGIFAAPGTLTNENAIYFLSAQVRSSQGAELVPLQAWKDAPYEDNGACLEGSQSQTAKAYNPISTSPEAQQQQESFSCATVDLGDGQGPGTGMGSFLVGLAMALFVFALRPRGNDFFV